MPRVLFAFVALAFVAPAAGREPGAHSCIVVQELSADRPLAMRGDGCAVRLSPASTFKIPHALVALETGVVSADTVEKWDGRKYERQPKWNRDHTVISALKPSVLWFYQRIAPRIGAAVMTSWLTKFDYGNRSVTGPITEYWINGHLAISVAEQAAFLRRFYQGRLPVDAVNIEMVRRGLDQMPGTIENSLGVHPLAGDWSRARLNAKTGATTTDRYRVSWLVGRLTAGERDYVFASAVWHAARAVDVLDAAHLAARTFVELGLLDSPR